MSEILKKYVCLNPFEYLDIQPTSQWLCCPSWCPSDIREGLDGKPLNGAKVNIFEDLKSNWFSKEAQNVRRSVLDGSYSHCNHKICPSLSQLINTGEQPKNFITQEEFKDRFGDVEKFDKLPKQILFGFDTSCNLKCPSCREKFVPNDDPQSDEFKIKKFILESIEYDFSESVEILMITGSGDPIYSKLYREYLINFDATKYPNLLQIHLITNGNMLNEAMWNKLKARPFIKTIEISIDAGTKETYENVTRLRGNWTELMKNLKFLSTQKSIKEITCSMVVSKNNYREMHQFYEIIKGIFEDSGIIYHVAYRQIVHWFYGAYSLADIKNLSIFDSIHPDHEDFKNELLKIHNKPNINHNFHHLI